MICGGLIQAAPEKAPKPTVIREQKPVAPAAKPKAATVAKAEAPAATTGYVEGKLPQAPKLPRLADRNSKAARIKRLSADLARVKWALNPKGYIQENPSRFKLVSMRDAKTSGLDENGTIYSFETNDGAELHIFKKAGNPNKYSYSTKGGDNPNSYKQFKIAGALPASNNSASLETALRSIHNGRSSMTQGFRHVLTEALQSGEHYQTINRNKPRVFDGSFRLSKRAASFLPNAPTGAAVDFRVERRSNGVSIAHISYVRTPGEEQTVSFKISTSLDRTLIALQQTKPAAPPTTDVAGRGKATRRR